jgi:hypothetical protein
MVKIDPKVDLINDPIKRARDMMFRQSQAFGIQYARPIGETDANKVPQMSKEELRRLSGRT